MGDLASQTILDDVVCLHPVMVKHLGTYILAAYLGSIHLGSHAAGTSSEKGFFRYLVVMFLPRCADLFFIAASFTDP